MDKAIKADAFPLLLVGKSGCGKTCAAAWVYSMWIHDARFYRANFLLEKLFEAKRESNFCSTFNSEICNYRKHHRSLLVIDDIFFRDPTPAKIELMAEIAEARKCFPTIYTSNMTHAEMSKAFDSRLVDRLTCGTIVKFTGNSKR